MLDKKLSQIQDSELENVSGGICCCCCGLYVMASNVAACVVMPRVTEVAETVPEANDLRRAHRKIIAGMVVGRQIAVRRRLTNDEIRDIIEGYIQGMNNANHVPNGNANNLV